MSAFVSNIDIPVFYNPNPSGTLTGYATGSLPDEMRVIFQGAEAFTSGSGGGQYNNAMDPTPFSGSALGTMPREMLHDGTASMSQMTNWSVRPAQRPGTHKAFDPGID